MKTLLTGGAGYIGSHTAIELIECGHDVCIIDNLANSSLAAIQRIELLTNKAVDFHQIDLLDAPSVDRLFDERHIDVVIHFAGSKSVAESVSKPLDYYRNNIGSTINLCSAMATHQVENLIFSSSATVYGEPKSLPIDENALIIDATNPYGRTKLMIEKLLEDISSANASWNIALLRYFNPGGAHSSGEIGEDPNGIPNNLLPFISQFAAGKRPQLTVFGEDYPTPDGTCIRDYIHVVDLAKGHLAAIDKLLEHPGLVTYNLGTGHGSSVLEVIHAFEKAIGSKLSYVVGERRPGDIPESYTDPSKAQTELDWRAEKTLDDICIDAWRWQQKNPNGYTS
jgi:UDP-glucose 4-epimerase